MGSKDTEAESIMRKSTHGIRTPRHLAQHSVYISCHSDFFMTVCSGGKVSAEGMRHGYISRLSVLFLSVGPMDGAQLCSSLLAGTGGCCWPKPNLFAIKEPFDCIVFTGAFPGPIRGCPQQRGWGEVYNRITFVYNLFLIDANKPVN